MGNGWSRKPNNEEINETIAHHEILIESNGQSADTNSEIVCLARRQLTPPPTDCRIEGVSPDGVTY